MHEVKNVYLGPLGGAIPAELLPVVKYVGAPPGWPMAIDPQTEEARMSDGSRRWAFFESVEDWGLGWGYLTKVQLDQLRTLVGLKQTLKYRDYNVDATEHDVVIMAFSYELTFSNMRGFPTYEADMTLREA